MIPSALFKTLPSNKKEESADMDLTCTHDFTSRLTSQKPINRLVPNWIDDVPLLLQSIHKRNFEEQRAWQFGTCPYGNDFITEIKTNKLIII